MIHVFYSQSWINQIIVESIIERENLKKEEVIILTNRNFNHVLDVSLLERTVQAKKILLSTTKQALYSYVQVHNFKKWFNLILKGNKYKLYVPHLYPIGLKYLYAHKNCVSISYIEEGLFSYHSLEKANKILPNEGFLKNMWFRWFNPFLYRIAKIPTLVSDFDFSYKIGDNAFPFSLKSVKFDVKSISNHNVVSLNVSNILVLAAFVDGAYKMKLEKYLDKMEDVLKWLLEKGITEVHYKFHPSDSEVVRNAIRILFKGYNERINLVELDESNSIELMILKKPVRVFMFNCSLAIYCYQFGVEFGILTKLVDENCEILNIGGIDFRPFYLN